MKLQYKLLVIVGTVYLLTLGAIHHGVPILRGGVESGLAHVTNSNLRHSTVDDVDAYKLNWRPKERVFFKKLRHEETKDTVEVKKVNGFQCNGENTGPSGRTAFEQIAPGVHIFSAYYDNRMTTKFIRMMTAIKSFKGKVDPNVFRNKLCMFKMDDSADNSTVYITIPVTFYEMCENHKRVFGGWILSCEVPSELQDIPLSLRIYGGKRNATDLSNSKEVCIKSFKKNVQKRKLDYGVCVPPIYGTVRPKEFIEFIEFNRLLGADKFILYVEMSENTVSLDLQRVFRHYSSLNIVRLISWQLPVRSEMIWYHGQSVAINDCMYRHMNDFHHIMFVDLDEFIIPRGELRNWDDVMKHFEKIDPVSFKDVSGFSFRSTYFAPDFSRRVFSSEMTSVVRTNRTRYFSYRRNKVIVRPSRVFEMGIHHVSRSWPDDKNYTVLSVPTDIAFIHHYRTCIREFGTPCNNRISDPTVPDKYGQQIQDNYLNTLYDIKY